MKKLALLLFISAGLFAQTNQPASFVELKTFINNQPLDLQMQSDNEVVLKKKSAPLAILYSLLLPGMGELYAGNYNTGKYFTIAEGVLWGTFAGMKYYSNWQKDNYLAYATSEGGVSVQGKDDDYFASIGNYMNIEDYNHEKELERDYASVYSEKTDYWNWKDDNQRKEYRNIWRSSEQASNNLRFVVGAMIINRVISAINAARIVGSYNRTLKEMTWNVSVGTISNPGSETGLSVNFVKSF